MVKIKKILSISLAVLFLLLVTASSVNASDEYPLGFDEYTASKYIQNVVVGNDNDPLNYNSGGVRILLTADGQKLGKTSSGAYHIADWAIYTWEVQTDKSWPTNWRSYSSVAREIRAHCWAPGIDTTTRYTTISFNGWTGKD